MNELSTKPIAMYPRCDGRRLLFEIVGDGRRVPCAISLMALEDLSETRCYRPTDQLKSFALARRQIEVIALKKIKMKAQDASGLLTCCRMPGDPSRAARQGDHRRDTAQEGAGSSWQA